MTTHYEIVERWFQRLMGETDKALFSTYSNIKCYDEDGRYGRARIDSYGSHFTLIRVLRSKSGKVLGFLLNGDRYSTSTTRHQSEVRAHAQRYAEKYGLVVVIVPFSALDSAGVVDFESIQVLDVSDDRIEHIPHREYAPPQRAQWLNRGGEQVRYGYVLPDEEKRSRYGMVTGEPVEYGTPGARYGHYTTNVPDAWHLSGVDRVILADGTVVDYKSPLPEKPSQERPAGAVYEWTTTRHWLGESLIRAKVRYWKRDRQGVHVGTAERWAHFISGFDHNEPRALYHLSELPGKQSRTIEEAYEELKPETVRVAEGNGREVKRQGDIFAVPTGFDTRSLTRSGGIRAKGGRLLSTSHVATETLTMPSGVTLARGTLRHDPQGWRRPDHVRVSLGKQWHVIVKNTVPVAA